MERARVVFLLFFLCGCLGSDDRHGEGRNWTLNSGQLQRNHRSRPPVLLQALWKDLQEKVSGGGQLDECNARGHHKQRTTMGVIIAPHQLTDDPDNGEISLEYPIQAEYPHPIRKARILGLLKQIRRRNVRHLIPYLRSSDGRIFKGQLRKKGKAVAFDVSGVVKPMYNSGRRLDANVTFALGIRETNGIRKSPWDIFNVASGPHGPLMHLQYQNTQCRQKSKGEVDEMVYKALVGNVTKI